MMVAKLSLGALAMGTSGSAAALGVRGTRGPGSSGSSAGSASAAAAGLVGFAIGSETLGSIVSPAAPAATRAAPDVRPRQPPRLHDARLDDGQAWPDRPLDRGLRLVFDAIHGADGLDLAAVDHPFEWPPRLDLERIKVGYIEQPGRPERRARRAEDPAQTWLRAGADHTSRRACRWRPSRSCWAPRPPPFRRVTRKHITEGLNTWPETFRNGQFVPAVEYLRAARVRTKLMQAMAERMAAVDLYVGSGQDLSITN